MARRQVDEVEEARLIAAHKVGDRAAGDALVAMHWPLIYKRAVAPVLRRPGAKEHVEELCQEARIGFVKGVTRWSADFGTKLTSYAIWWARQGVGSAYAEINGPIRLPKGQQDGTCTRKDYAQRAREARNVIHLEAPIAEGKSTVADIEADPSLPIDVRFDHADHVARIRRIVEELRQTLPRHSRLILERRLFVEAGEEASLQELGDELGITREWVRQLEVRLKKRIAQRLREVGVDEDSLK